MFIDDKIIKRKKKDYNWKKTYISKFEFLNTRLYTAFNSLRQTLYSVKTVSERI